MDSCCTPVSDELDPARAVDLAEMFKALSDPVRLRLLSIIASVPEGEVCACDVNEPLGRSQATVSHHLSKLVEAGLVTREQRGKWAWFRVRPERAEFVKAVLEETPVTVS
jgi:ArsR family transcriptional regulator, arsenate/arsenite/antimonite-responsive transcriptional repressor